jgi:hypothetical protein
MLLSDGSANKVSTVNDWNLEMGMSGTGNQSFS